MEIREGDIVVIRYEGPKGGPGMREMLAVTGAMKGAGRGADAALLAFAAALLALGFRAVWAVTAGTGT